MSSRLCSLASPGPVGVTEGPQAPLWPQQPWAPPTCFSSSPQHVPPSGWMTQPAQPSSVRQPMKTASLGPPEAWGTHRRPGLPQGSSLGSLAGDPRVRGSKVWSTRQGRGIRVDPSPGP